MSTKTRSNSKLRRPLQALLFTREHHGNILSKKKKSTVREGYRDYKTGKPVLLCCHINTFCIMATITKVKHCKVYELLIDEVRQEGFPDDKELLENLQKYYPDLQLTSEITYIEWDNIG